MNWVCWSPCVLLNADLFRDGEWEDDDETEDEEREAWVCVPVVWHVSLG